MNTPKKSVTSKKNKPAQEVQKKDSIEEATIKPEIRIISQGTCPKLTRRGKGLLSYEIGINDSSEKSMLRISGNETGGTFSIEWIDIGRIRSSIELNIKNQKYFKASIFTYLFSRKSNNNHGYLAAILKAEGVLKSFPEQPSQLLPGSWDMLNEKIDELKVQDINITDHIAIALQERADKRKKLMAEKQVSKAKQSDK